MRKSFGLLSVVLAMSAGISMSAQAQQGAPAKDPARWSTEDKTAQARYQTMKKEADAGYRENTKQCKTMSASERSACLKDAKATHKQDLDRAKQESKNAG